MRNRDFIISKLNLLELLSSVDDYILIKVWDEFPQYTTGSDIDLIILDKDEAIKDIYKFFQSIRNTTIALEINNVDNHCHLDFLAEDALELRVDLIDNFKDFKNIEIKPSYIAKLFMNRKTINYEGTNIYVPSDVDDLNS